MAVMPMSFFSQGSYPAASTVCATSSSDVYFLLLRPSTTLKCSYSVPLRASARVYSLTSLVHSVRRSTIIRMASIS